jgi:hypothetical protein
MKTKRWTKKGIELKSSNPQLFSVSTGPQMRLKGGAHRRDVDYKRSDRRREERDAKRMLS